MRLFDRSKRHVAPTVEGADFEGPARRALAEFDHAVAGMHDRATLRRGRVSLALLPSLAAGWLPTVLARFRALHPGIAVDVADVLSEPCIERVMTLQADFALAAVRAETPELQAQVFCADDFHLVCRADHPLATARAPIRLRDLAASPFIHLSRTSSVRQYLDAAFRPQAMDTVMEVEQLATVMGMVRAGLGISVVPALALFHFQQPELTTRPVKLARPGTADLPRAAERPESFDRGAGAARPGAGRAAGGDPRSSTLAGRSRAPAVRPPQPAIRRLAVRPARVAAYDRRMATAASPLLEPIAAGHRGERRLWLGYAGLCLLSWLLYVIAGIGADRGAWRLLGSDLRGHLEHGAADAARDAGAALGPLAAAAASGRAPPGSAPMRSAPSPSPRSGTLIDFGLVELVLRPRPRGRHLRAARPLAHAPGRCSSTPRWSRASAARSTPDGRIAAALVAAAGRGRRWCGPSWRRSAAS